MWQPSAEDAASGYQKGIIKPSNYVRKVLEKQLPSIFVQAQPPRRPTPSKSKNFTSQLKNQHITTFFGTSLTNDAVQTALMSFVDFCPFF